LRESRSNLTELIKRGITFSPILIHLDDEIDNFGISVSTLKGLSDNVGIVALVFSEPVDVKAWHLDMIFSTIKEMIYGLNQWDHLVMTSVKEI
jgi:hypothetical protein